MRKRYGILMVLAILVGVATPALAQDRSWQNKWYWGVQGGVQALYVGTRQVAPTVGAHWFITAGRSALYLAFDQQYLPRLTQVIRTGQSARFSNGQRFQATVFAIPSDTKLQVMLGGGFAINKITNASLASAGTALDLRHLEDAATKASLLVAAGLQYRPGLRWAIFGQYQYSPGNTDYVIRSAQHSLNLGIRYVVTHAEEVVTTER